MNKHVFAAALLMLTAVTAMAQREGGAGGHGLPPGKWWDRPEMVRKLSLTDDQRRRLDAVYAGSANDLIDARAAVEKANVALRAELDQAQVNRTTLQRLARQLIEARGRLFEREVLMFADMRGVLSQQQWEWFREQSRRARLRDAAPNSDRGYPGNNRRQ
ncbi:MAG TPA: periplasmic heavy metal sensor [Thermoanaerobaculia bacterium]|jgi:Spy/CpxP family protein refolding chaperone